MNLFPSFLFFIVFYLSISAFGINERLIVLAKLLKIIEIGEIIEKKV